VAIFGKSDTQGQVSAGDRPLGSAPAPAGGGPSATVIGPKARFVGELEGDEDILIQGRLEGNARVDRKVTVAPSGEVRGDLHARSVIVGGRVFGQIRAEERAELLASASVEGNVHAPKVVIAEGAQLQGSVAMSAVPVGASAPNPKKAVELEL
jgi:cytoskeletal protein CcmA (bactofilin family)